MHESLAFTNLFNKLFAGPLDSLLRMVHVQPVNPAAPIDDKFTLELLVVLGFIAFFAMVRMNLSVDKPGTPQQIAEMINEAIGGQAKQVIGHGYRSYQAFVTCIFLLCWPAIFLA